MMSNFERRYGRLDLAILGLIFLLGSLYVLISGRRYFDFDEFQVMYASAALVRGKALYADKIGTHFPLFNILISQLISITGFKTTAILIARYFVLSAIAITLIYVYRISAILWTKQTGLLAVAFALSTILFLNKGIEIRHDVFNTLFNVMGCYYAIRYLDDKKLTCLLFSGLCLGMAIASTQKAIIWSGGIILGVLLYLFRNKSYKQMGKTALSYATVLPIPLVVCVASLIFSNNETLASFLKHSIINVFIGFAPYTEVENPFPYDRYDLLKKLIFENHLFYALGIGGIVSVFVLEIKASHQKVILASWTLLGLLFYLTAKRPFDQSFLPNIPPLSILASGLITDISFFWKDISLNKRAGAVVAFSFLLFAWPFLLIFPKINEDNKTKDQISN
ncbi:ArnT family glycosyltransferase, partial [Thermodesulfobacteriota bacterium]